MKKSLRALEHAHDSRFGYLRVVRECPVCSTAYRADQVAVLHAAGHNHLVHLTCGACHNALLAMVVVSALGMSSIGVMTDLSAADAVRFGRRLPVSEADLLSFHQVLQNTQGLEALFTSRF